MSLPAPNLDDRRFQDLVDDAKRLVQQRCPEWTDHNVSDPGVTLIELFAWMTDQLVYRLNRVPDRVYVKFLELIGVRLFPPTSARADVTFWLSAPQAATVRVPPGTQVATMRTEQDEAIVFTVVEDLAIPPCSAVAAASVIGGELRDASDTLGNDQRFFYSFGDTPEPDDCLMVGLDTPVPSCALALRFDCEIEGVGPDAHTEWQEVSSFAGRGPDELAFDLDRTAGEIALGPAVREPDGTLRRYGAVPPKGALLRLRSYRTGGGRRGNVARGML